MTASPRGANGKEPAYQQRRQMQVRSLGMQDPLEESMATHSTILAWRIPWTENPGGLQSMGLRRVGHDIATEYAHMQPKVTQLNSWQRQFSNPVWYDSQSLCCNSPLFEASRKLLLPTEGTWRFSHLTSWTVGPEMGKGMRPNFPRSSHDNSSSPATTAPNGEMSQVGKWVGFG